MGLSRGIETALGASSPTAPRPVAIRRAAGNIPPIASAACRPYSLSSNKPGRVIAQITQQGSAI